MSGFRKFFPCIPAKQKPPLQLPDSNVVLVNPDDEDIFVQQSDGRCYSRRQISKAVAVVLSGYDSRAAAASVDMSCDPATVDLWVQLYTPPFFRNGMTCPPALILWWMKEMDRESQGLPPQIQREIQSQLATPPNPNPIGFFSLAQNSRPSEFGTTYMKIPFTAPNEAVKLTPIMSKGAGGNNTIVIASPSASQPNIRVFYESSPSTSNQRSNKSSSFQKLEAVTAQQQKEAEASLNALQAQTAALQSHNQAYQRQMSQGFSLSNSSPFPSYKGNPSSF